ncbi:hypothetical protein [Pseudaminobacter soli (ex Li et al. 2025)]|uniref:Uncharacterized protein n=1 Tax=Pseudaminobacter soli (ex Li et al. 2025) TaxID=1295366 RepID=A0A2P7SE55_9HYPH|nr:hypothetical protein [Mesorhizobium soli]PSJ60792.1 hypothetical protein C7I85_12175 [Mesorhizobium soli]
MSALSVTFTDLARALTPVKRVSVSQAMDAYAEIDAERRDALGRVASAVQIAVSGGTFYVASITETDFRIWKDFTDFLSDEFEMVGVARRDTAPDQQHSPDGYSHYLDQEKL